MNIEKTGQNIKKARKKRGLTQLEVAKQVGLHVNYFATVERGEIQAHIDTLSKIAKVLRVEPSEMIVL